MLDLTVFTPTYNRGYILEKLYISLCNQTNKSFEWLIVDDGSTDNTKELVDRFIDENKIKIRYFYQQNAGKSVAHNKGTDLAVGKLFVCVDSDDYITSDAVDTIINRWRKIETNVIGIVAKRMTPDGKNITKSSYSDFDLLVLRDAYQTRKLSGDTALIFQTEIIKQFKFPKFDDEKFVPEDYIYDQIGLLGKLSFLNKSIYMCEYLEDGYTQNMSKLIARNPNGYRAFAAQRVDLDGSLWTRLMDLIRYESVSFIIGNGFLLKGHIIGCLMAIIPGLLLYWRRFRKHLFT